MDTTTPLVLVVDDHLDTCQMLVRLLRRIRYQAVCLENAQAALGFIHKQIPGLMVVDMMMPEMSGLELLKAIRSRPETQGVPVVMYSAMSDPDMARQALDAGAQAFVIKGSTNFDQMRGIVETLAGRGSN